MSVRFVDIDESNWLDCIRIKVTEKQLEYVASKELTLSISFYNLLNKQEQSMNNPK
ncbi:hypothetical protein [Pseudoneobacillus sp. C159]